MGCFARPGVIRGGMGSLSQAIASSARDHGVDIRTNARVVNVCIQNGHTTGVLLAAGEEINAEVVVSNADPRTTFFNLVGAQSLGAAFVRDIRNIKYRGSAARIHLALRELPTFTAVPNGDAKKYLQGSVEIAPGMDYLQRAFDHTRYGTFSTHPYLDIHIPTLSDSSLAPDGQHILSITAKYAPYHLIDTDWESQRGAFGEVVLETLEEYAPNIRAAISHMQVLTPLDIEATNGLPEGNPNHGEMTLDQFFHMRPTANYARYRTPIRWSLSLWRGHAPGWWRDRHTRCECSPRDSEGFVIRMQSANGKLADPRAYRLPPEWDKHAGTWLQWPYERG